jgi:7-carboxy-7-deazaguanine synthase (Cx14CxxC type)
MSYVVKEIIYTLQGEGAQAGRAAVFCRFAACNLWSGYEADRSGAMCRFCDTDFVGTDGPNGGEFATADDLAEVIAREWPASTGKREGARSLVVCTGGEPLLQLDEPLVATLHHIGFEVGVETNGTIQPPAGIDWITVSPKAGAELLLEHGDELKLIYPQAGAEPERYEQLDFRAFFLQPMDGPDRDRNTKLAVRYCLDDPHWRLSLQTHKFIGIP